MSKAAYFLALGRRDVLAAKVCGGEVEARSASSEGDSPGELCKLGVDLLGQLGCSGELICLGLGADRAMSAAIESRGIPRKGRRTAMLYRLEEQLPIDAEQLTADFLPPTEGRSLAIAVATAPTREIIDSLASGGVEVGAIHPTAMLALQQVRRGLEDARYVVMPTFDELNVFAMAGGRPLGWYATASGKAEQALRYIHADLLTRPTDDPGAVAVIAKEPNDLAEALASDGPLQIAAIDADPLTLAAQAAPSLTGGEGCPDFRRDQLAMGSLWKRTGRLPAVTAAVTTLLLAALTGLFLLRGMQYSRIANTCRSAQLIEFDAVHPHSTPPPDIARYLADEHDRLRGISGAGADIPPRRSALNTLRNIAAALPQDMRLRITELRIAPGGMFMSGEARTFSDAEAVAAELAAAGFTVDPPRSESMPAGGVRFVINADSGSEPTVASMTTEDLP